MENYTTRYSRNYNDVQEVNGFFKYFDLILKLRFKDMKRNGRENKKRRDLRMRGER